MFALNSLLEENALHFGSVYELLDKVEIQIELKKKNFVSMEHLF